MKQLLSLLQVKLIVPLELEASSSILLVPGRGASTLYTWDNQELALG